MPSRLNASDGQPRPGLDFPTARRPAGSHGRDKLTGGMSPQSSAGPKHSPSAAFGPWPREQCRWSRNRAAQWDRCAGASAAPPAPTADVHDGARVIAPDHELRHGEAPVHVVRDHGSQATVQVVDDAAETLAPTRTRDPWWDRLNSATRQRQGSDRQGGGRVSPAGGRAARPTSDAHHRPAARHRRLRRHSRRSSQSETNRCMRVEWNEAVMAAGS